MLAIEDEHLYVHLADKLQESGRYVRMDSNWEMQPEIYEFLEAEGYAYAIRLPANSVLQAQIAHLLTRPVG